MACHGQGSYSLDCVEVDVLVVPLNAVPAQIDSKVVVDAVARPFRVAGAFLRLCALNLEISRYWSDVCEDGLVIDFDGRKFSCAVVGSLLVSSVGKVFLIRNFRNDHFR